MSLAVLAQAVRDTLQTAFSLTASSCEVSFDGQPKPSAGELYLAVHPGAWTKAEGDYDLDEEYTIGVTVTIRMGFAPKDRWGIEVWAASTDGLDKRVRQVIVAVHHNQAIRQLASTRLFQGEKYFVTPLQLLRVDPPKLQNWSWFSASPPEREGQIAESGVSQTVWFGKCRRCQSVDNME